MSELDFTKAQLRADYIRVLNVLVMLKSYTGKNMVVIGQISKHQQKIVEITEKLMKLEPGKWETTIKIWNLQAQIDRLESSE